MRLIAFVMVLLPYLIWLIISIPLWRRFGFMVPNFTLRVFLFGLIFSPVPYMRAYAGAVIPLVAYPFLLMSVKNKYPGLWVAPIVPFVVISLIYAATCALQSRRAR